MVALVVALLLVLAGAGYGAWALFLQPAATAAPQYRTMTVSKGAVKSTVSATGTLDPSRQSALTFSTSGEVTKVSVEVGDTVSKGDVLARIDDAELEIDAEAARAELAEAEDALDTLEDDTDATDTAIASATATVRVKKNAVTQADTALDDATLVAPFSGTIAAVGLAKGDTVGSSSSSGSTGSGRLRQLRQRSGFHERCRHLDVGQLGRVDHLDQHRAVRRHHLGLQHRPGVDEEGAAGHHHPDRQR